MHAGIKTPLCGLIEHKMARLQITLLLIISSSVFGQNALEISSFIGRDFTLTSASEYTFSSFGFHAKHITRPYEEKNWHHYFNLPRTGQELLYSQYSVNGYSLALNTFIEFDILSSMKHEFFISPSLGLAYTSETSSSLSDYRLTSLPVNASIKLELGYRFTISPAWKVSVGYLLTHFSNGNISSPNDGLNMKAWRLGINYSYDDSDSPKYTHFEKPAFNKFVAQVSFGSGVKNRADQQYVFLNGFVNIGVNIHPFHRLVVGSGVFTDKSLAENPKQTRLGLSFGYQILIGKVGFSFQPGWYLKSYYRATRYYLFVLQYKFHPHLFIQSNLRTSNQFFSEDLSIGLGFEF